LLLVINDTCLEFKSGMVAANGYRFGGIENGAHIKKLGSENKVSTHKGRSN
jgi:hypothetical protein